MNTSISQSTNPATAAAASTAFTHCTPTKKCPSSCGKQSEQRVFNFNDSYVNDYLIQQNQQHPLNQNQVFNRPITRSITHHNNKFNSNDLVASTSSNDNCSNDLNNYEPPFCNVPNFNDGLNNNQNSESTQYEILTSSSSSNNSQHNTVRISTPVSSNTTANNSATTENNVILNPPPCKRMKRCSTILID
jgi:E3 ubiquitin-protein ligase DOA10